MAVDLYSCFLEDLATGGIRPGERLGEHSLATRWQAGRMPVRETLLRLEHDGLVERRPRSGTFVRQLEDEELFEIYDIRIAMEPPLAKTATERATDADIAELQQLAAASDELGSGPLVLEARDRAFHQKVYALSGKALTTRLLNLAALHLSCSTIHRRVLTLGSYTVSQPDHRPIAAAMAERDASLAAALMREHLVAAKAAVVEDIARVHADAAEARATSRAVGGS